MKRSTQSLKYSRYIITIIFLDRGDNFQGDGDKVNGLKKLNEM